MTERSPVEVVSRPGGNREDGRPGIAKRKIEEEKAAQCFALVPNTVKQPQMGTLTAKKECDGVFRRWKRAVPDIVISLEH